MIDLITLITSNCDDHELGNLEYLIRKELRERAVNALTETPKPTSEEFAMLKESPSKAMACYRDRTGVSYWATGGIFNRLYGISVR